MNIDRRTLLGAAAAASLALPRRSRAQSPVVKLGVLNDMSGPYRDIGGMNSVNAVRLAVQEFGPGLNCEVVFADHQNKPDVGAGIARQWFDQEGVDVILDVPTSSVALAVNSVCKEKNKVFIDSGAATTDLTGSQCTPVTIHWSYDTYMLAQSTGGAMVRAGGTKLVFHHRRLRVRPAAAARHDRPSSPRRVARSWAPRPIRSRVPRTSPPS